MIVLKFVEICFEMSVVYVAKMMMMINFQYFYSHNTFTIYSVLGH